MQERPAWGLPIVRGMALVLRAEIHYEPNVPTGACFVVRLPPACTARWEV
jgi:hypothetical protein